MEYFVDLLEELVRLANYSSVMAIFGSLSQNSIHRLKSTWNQVCSDRLDMLEMYATLLSPLKKFKHLKDAIDQSQPPCIPYLGLFLADLTTVDATIDEDSADCLINVNKKRVFTRILKHIQTFQNYSYKIQPVPYLQHYFVQEFAKTPLTDEQEFKLSLLIEPKKTKNGIIAATG